MIWRIIYKFLLNDKVVDKLADSYPIRRAAQWVVYFFNKSKAINSSDDLTKTKNFIAQKAINKFSEKIEEKLKKVAEDLEKKAKKY